MYDELRHRRTSGSSGLVSPRRRCPLRQPTAKLGGQKLQSVPIDRHMDSYRNRKSPPAVELRERAHPQECSNNRRNPILKRAQRMPGQVHGALMGGMSAVPTCRVPRSLPHGLDAPGISLDCRRSRERKAFPACRAASEKRCRTAHLIRGIRDQFISSDVASRGA